MPSFPTYERQLSPNARQPFGEKQPNTQYAQALQNLGVNMGRMGQTLGEIDAKVYKIEKARKELDAQIKIQEKINERTYEFNTNTDPAKRQSIYDGLTSDVNAIVNGLDDTDSKNEMGIRARGLLNTTTFAMKKLALERDVTTAQNNIEVLGQTYLNSIMTGDNAAELSSRAGFLASLDSYASLTGQPAGWKETKINDIEHKADISRAERVAEINPYTFIKEVDNFKLTPEEKSKVLGYAEGRRRDIEYKNRCDELDKVISLQSDFPSDGTRKDLDYIVASGAKVDPKWLAAARMLVDDKEKQNVVVDDPIVADALYNEKVKTFGIDKETGNLARKEVAFWDKEKNKQQIITFLAHAKAAQAAGKLKKETYENLATDAKRLADVREDMGVAKMNYAYSFIRNMAFQEEPILSAERAYRKYQELAPVLQKANPADIDKIITESFGRKFELRDDREKGKAGINRHEVYNPDTGEFE